MRSRVLTLVSALVVTAGLGAVPIATPATAAMAPRAAARTSTPAPLPVPYNSVVAIADAAARPGGSPPGSNDWTCRPSAAHPRPVVLVNGTFANMTINWNSAAPLLKNNGYCVFAFNYGGSYLGGAITAIGPIEQSAAELSAFVDRVRSATGSAKVDLVGHSQGGMMPRYYLKFLGGAVKVNALVGLAPSNHGTTADGIVELAGSLPGASDFVGSLCAACTQQFAGSSFLTNLNAGGDTVPGVRYTVITSRYDEVVTPYTSAFLSGPNTTNITVQDGCFLNFADHLSVAFDRRSLAYVLNALDPAHPRWAPCTLSVYGVGG